MNISKILNSINRKIYGAEPFKADVPDHDCGLIGGPDGHCHVCQKIWDETTEGKDGKIEKFLDPEGKNLSQEVMYKELWNIIGARKDEEMQSNVLSPKESEFQENFPEH